MSSFSQPIFRFCDLPGEIRKKIYKELLCDFKTQPLTIHGGDWLNFAPARGNIDGAILRTNSTVHREARDVLIKTNRFVKITSADGLPLKLLLCATQVPIVSSNREVVERFKSYVLEVDLGITVALPRTEDTDSMGLLDGYTLMILHRDLGLFCKALTDGDAHSPGFTARLKIGITVAPVLIEEGAEHLQEFFSKTTQQTLLAPFRSTLRGCKNVKIQGRVDQQLALAVKEDLGKEGWSDHEPVLMNLVNAKRIGSELFQQRKMEEASLAWLDAAVDIDKMHDSTSWPLLVQSGGEAFISQIAELYVIIRLNAAQVHLTKMQSSPSNKYAAGLMTEDSLNSATRSLKQDYWMEGFKHRPSIQLSTKLRYRFALFLRLQNEPGTADRALNHINRALRLQPNDVGILRERDNIVAWQARGS